MAHVLYMNSGSSYELYMYLGSWGLTALGTQRGYSPFAQSLAPLRVTDGQTHLARDDIDDAAEGKLRDRAAVHVGVAAHVAAVEVVVAERGAARDGRHVELGCPVSSAAAPRAAAEGPCESVSAWEFFFSFFFRKIDGAESCCACMLVYELGHGARGVCALVLSGWGHRRSICGAGSRCASAGGKMTERREPA